ncbi:MAG: hypothetical protein ACRDBO_02600 [Lachnospiraceae bacterium]
MATILNDIGLYKKQLLALFLDSADIRECLLDGQNGSADTLINQQVYPYLYVDNSRMDPLTYLDVEVDIPKLPSRTIKDIKITIWAYCHKDIMEYTKDGYCGTRSDILADMADRQIAGSGISGIGTLNLTSAAHIMPASNFYGLELIYTTSDFKVKG